MTWQWIRRRSKKGRWKDTREDDDQRRPAVVSDLFNSLTTSESEVVQGILDFSYCLRTSCCPSWFFFLCLPFLFWTSYCSGSWIQVIRYPEPLFLLLLYDLSIHTEDSHAFWDAGWACENDTRIMRWSLLRLEFLCVKDLSLLNWFACRRFVSSHLCRRVKDDDRKTNPVPTVFDTDDLSLYDEKSPKMLNWEGIIG